MRAAIPSSDRQSDFSAILCQSLSLPYWSQRRIRRCTKPWTAFKPSVNCEQQGPAEDGPLDIWITVEDAWLRLARTRPVTVMHRCGQLELVFANFKSADCHERHHEFIASIVDLNFYRWQFNGHGGNLVQFIDYRGNDLVLQITDLKTIQRWIDGEDLAGQVLSFLLGFQEGSAP